MKVRGLDGKTYNWKLNGHVPLLDESKPRSSYHLSARKVLTELFPADILLEEVSLPGSGGLFGDFFLPSKSLMLEVQGEQHYRFIPRFHLTILGFIAAKKRDANKRQWCHLNSIQLIELPYWEKPDDWRNRINTRNNQVNRRVD